MTGMETGTELATIERAMGDRHSEYFTGPRIDGETVMARRYRSLLEGAAMPEPDTSAPIEAPSGQWASATGREILEQWSGRGGIERNYEAARVFAGEAMADVPEQTRAELLEQIGGLPDAVQVAMIAELADPYVRTGAATQGQMSRFAATPEGAELVREWGGAAPRRLATVAARVRRLVDRLPADQAADFAHFADHISPAEFKALANYLSR